ncbi:hypothetical protein AALP_AA1G191700 [Arabis alpina]|uniref:Uncharacterized protein n=1 Tax=Arabis alpina TaxID=50452 RepID=A0A087HP71_ARAAL|nr:hypothetical protein AALP_AA1G191700 [Arabis alpina]
MTDERRINDPKDAAPRDLEEGEIQAEGSTNKDQAASDNPPPTGAARADLPGEKSKEPPRASSLFPELLQKMSAKLDALLESAERQNRANEMITDELRSIGADILARSLEPDLFRKPAAGIDPVVFNFTTPVGSSIRPRQHNPSTATKDGQSALLAQARREKERVGDDLIDLDNDDEDLARRVVPDTIFIETTTDRHGTTKARNDDPRYVDSQQFSTFGDHDSMRRVARNADSPEEEVARRTTTRQMHADPQRMTQQHFPAFDDEIDPGYARDISEEEENIEWVKQVEVAEAKQAAIRAQHDEMAEFRASLNKTTAELKTIRSQMHRATSKAPELDLILEQA